nr:MAG TPA: hypothetical protein [Caudoviricetes sp.]
MDIISNSLSVYNILFDNPAAATYNRLNRTRRA